MHLETSRGSQMGFSLHRTAQSEWRSGGREDAKESGLSGERDAEPMSLLRLLHVVPTKGNWPGTLTVQKAALEKGTRQGLVMKGQDSTGGIGTSGTVS